MPGDQIHQRDMTGRTMRNLIHVASLALLAAAMGCGPRVESSNYVLPSDLGADLGADAAPDTISPSSFLAVRLGSDEVRAGLVEDPEELIGGLKADGRIGDAKIYNSHVGPGPHLRRWPDSLRRGLGAGPGLRGPLGRRRLLDPVRVLVHHHRHAGLLRHRARGDGDPGLLVRGHRERSVGAG